MAKFNKLEKWIAQTLSKFPTVKNKLKFSYSYINAQIYRKGYRFKSERDVQSIAGKSHESFFGYYDHSPQNSKGQVLCHFSELNTEKLPSPDYPIQIALFESEDNVHPNYTIKSRAYNWQQASRTQWLNDKLFIFNDYDRIKKRYISRVHAVDSEEEIKRFAFPVQDAYQTDFFLSLNYQRLLALRPDYGYRNLPPLNTEELQNLANDGIWHVDYESGDSQLLLPLNKIVHTNYKDTFNDALHYVNHIMISPDGKKFIFLHRFFKNGERFDRLMVSDKNAGEIKVLADYKMVSHCCWMDNNRVLGFLNNDDGKPGYYIINIETGRFKSYADGKLDDLGDGHPNVNGEWFVSDTYPDKSRMQNLMLNNLETGESIKLGEFFHGFNFNGETRCDLHPRFSPSGNKVYFDSVYKGKRQLYMIDLEK